MNSSQKRTVMISMNILSILLVLIFIRFGGSHDYKNSIMVVSLGKSPLPSPYSYLDGPWGLLVRLGGFGIVFGVVMPMILVASSAFLAKSDQ